MMSNPAAAAAAAADALAAAEHASLAEAGEERASWLMGCQRVNKEQVTLSLSRRICNDGSRCSVFVGSLADVDTEW